MKKRLTAALLLKILWYQLTIGLSKRNEESRVANRHVNRERLKGKISELIDIIKVGGPDALCLTETTRRISAPSGIIVLGLVYLKVIMLALESYCPIVSFSV